VEAWVAELCRRFGHRPIAVAVEQVKGALVFLLNKYECLHIFPVPSTMTARCARRCIPREPRMTCGMPICCGIYWRDIGTSCIVCRRMTRLRNRHGLGPTTSNSDAGATTTTQRCERWLSNGFALYSVAGKIGSPMTKADTWRRWRGEAHHSANSSKLACEVCEIPVDPE